MPTVEFQLDAARLYQDAQIVNVACAAKALVLSDWALCEDDADGYGFPYRQDILAPSMQIKKEVVLAAFPVREASLLIHHTNEVPWKSETYAATVDGRINGHPLRATLGYGWNVIPLEPAHLRPGTNQIVLATAPGSRPAIVPLADGRDILANAPWRSSQRPRSFKSTDAGQNWSSALGTDSVSTGEYLIRLHVRQHPAAGHAVSAIIDLLDPDRTNPIKGLATLCRLSAHIDADTPDGTQLLCFLRTGQTPVFTPAAWDDWRPLASGHTPRGRYVQLKILLTTADPLCTPALRSVSFTAEADTAAAAPGLTVEEYRVAPIVRSSLPFQYEPLAHPLLQQLRRQYELDEVVAGAATQFDRVVRLNHWVSQQWDWHTPEIYPPWSALAILEKQADGKPLGGFCGHYAIVLTQCCLALGIQARFVFGDWPGVISGHEIVEFWSDDLAKWVLMDPNMDRYYLDRATRVPLNALELHQALLQHYYQDRALGTPAQNKDRFETLGFPDYAASGPVIVHGGHNAGPDWFDPVRAHLMWGRPHYMPRNSFLSVPAPLPKAHGFGMPWSWNGYYHWCDAQTPRAPVFAMYSDRPADFYWSLHEVDITLEQTTVPGILHVTADTFTPELDAFLLSRDGGPWSPTPPVFTWQLQPGANTLAIRTRNTAGTEGRPSTVRLHWSPLTTDI